ncbi:E3 ubiquitin-protein ligase UPL5-like [Eucalyptus grandis]|uniref:E3 ubiquitin-protein ligase UPL5-like n=1 Tax=Eucalyptus grandis TaxID=71139 RepID=UPI00192F0049|nr:E3 ubiquitin-protein ligase UPL5-like [Eucalyptus grandis]
MPVGPRRSPPPAPRLHEPVPRRGDRRPRRRVSSSPANGGRRLASRLQCAIQNDAELHLVGRIRSKGHQQARRIIGDTISLVHGLCKGETVPNALKTIKTKIWEYLSMTPKKDGHPATEHLQIFMSSSAPAALVMLYMSTIGGNKDLAEESIRHFLKSCITELPESLRSHCAPIVLEFCRRLRIIGPHDPLYLSCRSSFQSMMKFTEVQWVSEHTKSVKRAIFIKEIFPFVKELADKLSKDLELSLHTIANVETWSAICDFTMFLCPLRTVMSGYIGFEHPISLPMEIEHHDVLLCKEEVESLYQIFENMLKKMDKCLLRMEQHLSAIVSGEIDIACPEWS